MTSHALAAENAGPLEKVPAAGPLRATAFDDLDAVVAAYEQRIFRFLLVSLRDRATAESLTQDTFLRAWSTRASFRGDCAVYTWLIRIAINLSRDHTRTGHFRFWRRASANSVDIANVAHCLPLRESSIESRMIASEQVTMIWESVAALSGRQRNIFLLRFVEELDLAEIAAITQLSISTVKSHLYRALATVRKRHREMQPETKETL
ncbi:MAG: sigma-70 family RNA polymerase sigma factor [Acidobacteriaceae bacterium]|nr:sigma-70 family RNA polymerase sigma factor [Acidobacteriaceae bacterium]